MHIARSWRRDEVTDIEDSEAQLIRDGSESGFEKSCNLKAMPDDSVPSGRVVLLTRNGKDGVDDE